MKKTLLSLALIGIAGGMYAQKQVGDALLLHRPDQITVTRDYDTLYSAVWDDPNTEAALYGVSDDGGYIFGTNTYGDRSKGKAFLAPSSTALTGAIFWFAMKYETGAPGSHITVKAHAMNGPGFITPGSGSTATSTNEAPGSVLGSVDVPMSDVDTSNWTIVEFDHALGVGDYFAVSFDMSGMAEGDSIGLVSSTDGVVEYPEFTWEQWSDGSWWTLPAAGWGGGTFDVDLFILAVINDDFVGIHDEGTFNGMRMSFLNGNPFSGDVLQVAYTTENASNMKVLVIDATGRAVVNRDLGNIGAGSHNLNLDASEWGAGNYYVSLVANGQPITKKVVKVQ